MPPRSLTVPSALVAAVLVLGTSACSDDPDGSPPPAVHTAADGTVFNDADADFGAALVQHHALALTLVDWTRERDLSPEVTALADEILTVEGPEIQTLTELLGSWDRPVPDTVRDHSHVGHDATTSFAGDIPGGDLPGMPTPDDLTSLLALEGDEFEQRWLELMIAHHEGAIELAEDEVDAGRDPAAVDLAESVADTQQDQVSRMKALLDG